MQEPSRFMQAWYKWKSLRLPWRKKWLVGFDLNGRTYWEFTNELNRSRPRRKVEYPRNTHYGDVAFTPAWLQWLRHTRRETPSIQEQLFEVQRQQQLKYLAAKADERWNSKASYLDAPEETGQRKPLLRPRDEGGYGLGTGGDRQSAGLDGTQNIVEGESEQSPRQDSEKPSTTGQNRESKPNPWARANTSGESWQPQQWSPGSAERR